MEGKMMDAISRSAVLDIIKEERRFIESLRETTFDNEDRAHNTGELGCAIRLARKIKDIPAIDVAPVVHARWRYKVAYAVNARVTNIIYCTACGKGFHRIEGVNFNFCPNCGARTDGGVDV